MKLIFDHENKSSSYLIFEVEIDGKHVNLFVDAELFALAILDGLHPTKYITQGLELVIGD